MTKPYKLCKLAADQDFEKAFATLAYTELEQKAPGLFPYLVGFQLVKKNDKDSHAFGVFGFHVAGQWYYGPVFWLNGRIKGYELLYIVSQDLFVPLQESWINHLTNKQPYVLGEGDKRSPAEMGSVAPDFTIFRRSPLLKTSADVQSEFYAADKTNMFKALSHSKPLTETLTSLPPKYACTLLTHMKEDPTFAEAVYTFYDPKDILNAVTKIAGDSLWKTADDSESSKLKFIPGEKNKVTVLHGDVTDNIDSFTPLTAQEKEKLMTGAAIVRDNRDDKSVSDVYDEPVFNNTFQNPTRSGLWRVLMKTGKFSNAFVSSSPMSVGQANVPGCLLTVGLDDKKALLSNTQAVFAKSQSDPMQVQKFLDDLPSLSSISVGDVGTIIGKDLKATFVFRVNSIIKGTNGAKTLDVDVQDDIEWFKDKPDGNYGSPIERRSVEYTYEKYDRGTFIQVLPGVSKMNNIRETLVVGDEFGKFLKLGTCPKPPKAKEGRGCIPCGDNWWEWRKENKLQIGSESDIDMHMRRLGLHKLSMTYDGNSELAYTYRGERTRRLSPKEAAAKLIVELGMREKVANEIIKKARLNKRCTVIVKQAQGLTFDQPGAAYDDMYRSSVVTPHEQEIPYPSITENREPAPVDDATFRQQATAAAAAGQKDVFDVSVLTALARDSRVDDHLSEFLKDIIVGNDRIGRILFLYYWHFDQFVDKYGTDDMIELEDMLKEVFKSTGEVVLFLKQKSVESQAVANEAVVDL